MTGSRISKSYDLTVLTVMGGVFACFETLEEVTLSGDLNDKKEDTLGKEYFRGHNSEQKSRKKRQ